MLHMIRGCRVPDPGILQESFEQKGKSFYANLHSEHIEGAIRALLHRQKEDLFFFLELPTGRDEEKKLQMEWKGLKTVFVLSYPNGKYDKFLPDILKEEEYLAAVTGDAGLNTFQTDPYRLLRTNIPPCRFGIREFRLRIWKAKALALLGLWQNTGTMAQ